ncbi:MAG: manganese efflux pump [Bacteroidetes bacterium]|nr:manganese efflux pump [Bacteroidota bacterium]
MTLTLSLLISIGLAMDAFAVSISKGLSSIENHVKLGLKLALTFGLFQSGMTLLGYFGGLSFRSLIEGFDHWIAFGLLLLVGGKMIYEALFEKEEEESAETGILSTKTLLILGLATSIDAMVVGISFSILNFSLVLPVILIGVVTALFSFLGVFIGKWAGHLLGKQAEVVGGLILIGIGIKILFEHLG